jgi:hypothetical protein
MNSRRVVLCLGALLSALLVTSASAFAAKSKSTAPSVSSVSPMQIKVGEKLTVKGKNFVPGTGKTRVLFVRRGGGAAFARAETATKTKLVVTVPAQLDQVLAGKASRVQLRVLGKKFGTLSPASKSPIVSPAAASDPVDTGPARPSGDCDKDGIPNSAETDMDNDLLPNDLEKSLGLDPCSADTDLDGVPDGYEWQSASTSTGRSCSARARRRRTQASGPTRTRSSRTPTWTTTATASRSARRHRSGSTSGTARWR